MTYDIDPLIRLCPDCNAQVLHAHQRGADRIDLLEPGATAVLVPSGGTAAVVQMARTYHRCPRAQAQIPHTERVDP